MTFILLGIMAIVVMRIDMGTADGTYAKMDMPYT